MMKRIVETSQRPRARITGVLYLLYFLTAGLGAFLDGRGLIVYSDATNVVSIVCYVAVTLLFYDMFKPVNRNLSFSRRSSVSWGAPLRLLASLISPRPASALSCFSDPTAS